MYADLCYMAGGGVEYSALLRFSYGAIYGFYERLKALHEIKQGEQRNVLNAFAAMMGGG